jgi:L-aspartate oxidase
MVDVIIVGSGLAGLFCAYKLLKFTKNILIISKGSLNISNSYWAQGGIAAVVSNNDSIENHYEDTIKAGDGLCDEERVKNLIKYGREIVLELINENAPFDKIQDELSLSIEGGHSVARILHAGGIQTGKNLVDFIYNKIKNHINILENTTLLDLIKKEQRIYGIVVQRDNEIFKIYSKFVVLATGGASGLYVRTTNPYTSTGEAMFIAYKNSVILENLEFVQFHPTVFFAPDNSRILITEALRGDGAILLNEKNERFVNEKDTRDKVSRAIVEQKQVYIYAGHLDKNLLLEKYNYLYNVLKLYGYDLLKDKIPVKPAAHYFIGGIQTDLIGKTNLENLYAIGECASSRVHGANRLASNSLLECIVMGKLCAMDISEKLSKVKIENVEYKSNLEIPQITQEEREILDNFGFIIRDGESLKNAINKIKNENLIKLILTFALKREESRGVHYRIDFPNKNEKFLGYFYIKDNEIGFERKS